MEEIKLNPIGYAKNDEKQHFGGWREVVSEIVVNEEWKDALFGLSDFSHIIVVYFMHKIKTCDIRHIPQGKKGEVPEVGIFACRCPARPNPIGISTVKLLSVKDNIITVQGLDVIQDTPILDIKPYTPQYDMPKNPKIPDWINKLDY